MLEIRTIDHVSLPATDVEKSREFYRDVLGLTEISRPRAFTEGPDKFDGAWFQVGSRELHLIKDANSTFREGGVSSRDIHFAVGVANYDETVAHLEAKGYRTDAPEGDLKRMRANREARAGFPQIYILDPDRNVIELNVRPDKQLTP